jgi:hypothetical protein
MIRSEHPYAVAKQGLKSSDGIEPGPEHRHPGAEQHEAGHHDLRIPGILRARPLSCTSAAE